MDDLKKTHNIIKENKKIRIELIFPPDFIYSLDKLYVIYDPLLKIKEIEGDIPDAIKDNMQKYSNKTVTDFVEFIEENLNVFCSGKIPDNPEKEIITENKPMKELINYKFNVNKTINSNIKMDVSKENITIFTCKNINLKISCNRCNKLQNTSESRSCDKCSNEINIKFVPVIDPSYLGFLHLKGCKLILFDCNQYQLQCENCNKIYETKPTAVKEKFVQKCFSCFKVLKFTVNKLLFVEKKKVFIKEGEELPNRGACKHYSKSFRWFRFPCCNSLYPCDICHDEEANHESELANKMVCGLCSKEQSVKKECDCGMSLITKHKRFWEGGRGNRDKTSMSKKDSHKFKR
ncbi:hypothetical protein NUSPORA_00053 [Nucleospora cyclopteri]